MITTDFVLPSYIFVGVGFVYDLKSIAYSTHVLRLPSANTKGEPFIHELITTDVRTTSKVNHLFSMINISSRSC